MTESNVFELGSIDRTNLSHRFEATLLAPLRKIESHSLSILSAQPLLAYSPDTPQQPFLGFFEDLPCFSYLIAQLCAWALFLTFWTFCAGFQNFLPISQYFNPGNELIDGVRFPGFPPRLWNLDVPLGKYQAQSPARYVLGMLPWILLFAPTYSVVYLLAYPRSALVDIPWLRYRYPVLLMPLKILLNLLLPMGLILLAMWSWIKFSLELSLLIWAGVVGLCFMGLSGHQLAFVLSRQDNRLVPIRLLRWGAR